MGASTRSTAGGGALMRSRPEAIPRRPPTRPPGPPTSRSAGATFESSSSPASVSATLRVVRFIRRTPRRSSRSRSRWLRLDTDTRISTAARRKLRVRATATKTSRSRRSGSAIVRQCEQAILDCPAYRRNRSGAYQASSRGAVSAFSRRAIMEQRKLGSTGPTVSALGLGCMGMSEVYGPADRGETIATIHAALDAGITLVDTGDFYAMGHNEMLVREALKDVPRDKVQISVKFGARRGPAGEFTGMDTRPAATRNFLAYSLQRLGTDYIDVYRPARLDPHISLGGTLGGTPPPSA